FPVIDETEELTDAVSVTEVPSAALVADELSEVDMDPTFGVGVGVGVGATVPPPPPQLMQNASIKNIVMRRACQELRFPAISTMQPKAARVHIRTRPLATLSLDWVADEGAGVEMVNCVVAGTPLTVSEDGLNAQVAPRGRPVPQLNVTTVFNPAAGVTVRVT